IHSPAPEVKVLEALVGELLIQAPAADKSACRSAVEPAQPGVAHVDRYWPTSPQILRVARVIRRGKRDASMTTVPPDGKAQGALCRNVDGVRAERPHLSQDVRSGPQRKSDLRIARRRDTEHPLRRNHPDFMSQLREVVDCRLESCNYAIGLGSPGVSCN